MDEKQKIYKQTRATFTDTVKAQEELRVEIDRLEENNTFVKKDERKNFFILLAKSMLGLDFEKKCEIRLPDITGIEIKNFGNFIRHLAYYEKDNIDYGFLKRYGKRLEINVPIRWIWHEVKFIIFGIYPEAIGVSVRISKEIIQDKRPVPVVSTVKK